MKMKPVKWPSIKPIALAVAISACAANVAFASMPTELQDAWQNGWIAGANTTSPAAYATVSRGVVAGGSMTVKSRIVNANLVNFVPPGWKAGCGGISLFGGSFSFINADQFIALMKAVASNAAGYAFQLALSNACPSCASWIETLQKKIQKLNQMFRNSCQLAKGIVKGGMDAINNKGNFMTTMKNSIFGLSDDQAAADSDSDPLGTAVSHNSAYWRKMRGNITYKALRDRGVIHGGVFFGGDQEYAETLMAYTGVLSLSKNPVNDTSVADGGKTVPYQTLPKLNALKTLIEGGKIQRYSCHGDTTDCANPTKVETNIQGLRAIVAADLRNIVAKLASNSGTLSEREKAILISMPDGTGAALRTLSLKNRGSADSFAEKAAGPVAYNIATKIVRDAMNVINAALRVNDHPAANMAVKFFETSWEDLRNEQLELADRYDTAQLLQNYQLQIQMAKKTELMVVSNLLYSGAESSRIPGR